MNDVIAPKRSSLKPKLIEAEMFLKLNMSLNPNNLAYFMEFLIWNTLVPSRLKLSDDIDHSNDINEEEEEDLSRVPVKSEEANYTCSFYACQFPCATTWKYKANKEKYNQLYIWMDFTLVYNDYAYHIVF